MNCTEARERLTAHLMGEDPVLREHLDRCDACSDEARSLRATLDLLTRYDRAAVLRPRRRLAPLAFAAAMLLAAAAWVLHAPSPRPSLTATGNFLVANGSGWTFATGRVAIDHDLRVAALPGAPVSLGAGFSLDGGSRARVTASGDVSLDQGNASVSHRAVTAGGWTIDATHAEARIERDRGEVRVEVTSGVVEARHNGTTRRLQAPAEVVLATGAADAPIVLIAAVPLSVAAGTPAPAEFARHLADGTRELKLQAIRMAVLLELKELAPALRRVAAGGDGADLRKSALYACWRLDPDRAFFRERAEQEADPVVKSEAIFFLGDSADPDDVAFLVRCVPDPSAIFALARIARRELALPPGLDETILSLFAQRTGRARTACLRYLLERRLVTVDQARSLLFNPHEEPLNRRLAATRLLAADREEAAADFRLLFESEGEESRIVAIDLLCHYGTMSDAKTVAALLDSGTPRQRERVFYALGLKANADLQPPVPLRPKPGQEEETRRRLMEWVNQ